jgi:hypothetical protein
VRGLRSRCGCCAGRLDSSGASVITDEIVDGAEGVIAAGAPVPYAEPAAGAVFVPFESAAPEAPLAWANAVAGKAAAHANAIVIAPTRPASIRIGTRSDRRATAVAIET